ncbi:MAG: serine/threonine protein kinase [Proteobacteria bacterium]|nr:serine/threonine protein kinase [Pseudomonadota bacterium]
MVYKTKPVQAPSSSDILSITLEPPSSCSPNTDWMVVSCEDRNESEDDSEILALRDHPQLRGNYDILRRIGRGAQGAVYSAFHSATGTIVAIKALSFREIADWKASDLFMREIALLKSMQIEGTPRYIDAIDATASPLPYYFLVQDYIPGKTLQSMLDGGKKFSTQEVIAIALAIIPILEKLRSYSPPIVHRDIKPSNIMMTPQGDIYLIDFGAAMFSERRTGGSTFAGTAGYMAPEQCMGTSTPDSDVYGLGATLIHLLTGIAPYKMQMLERSAIVPKTKKKQSFLALLQKPFSALADTIRKRSRSGRKKRASSFPCAMTLRFKPHLPRATPQWLVELLEVMVLPYPNQRVKSLNRLVRAIRTIGRAKLDSHSMHADTAARLESMKKLGHEYIIPDDITTLWLILVAPSFIFVPAFIFTQFYFLLYYFEKFIFYFTLGMLFVPVLLLVYRRILFNTANGVDPMQGVLKRYRSATEPTALALPRTKSSVHENQAWDISWKESEPVEPSRDKQR